MRVLQVSSATTWGGGEQHLAELIRGLAGRGHQVELVLRPGSPLRTVCAPDATAVHELPLKNSLDLVSVSRLADIIRVREPQIVHAHLGRDYPVCALAVRSRPATRLVLTRHHYLPMKTNLVYRKILSSVGKVIAVSGFVREQLLSAGWEESRVTTIYNWLSPRPGGAAMDGLPENPDGRKARLRRPWGVMGSPMIGSAGSLTPAKGHEDLLRAAKGISDAFPEAGFVVAGDDPNREKITAIRLEALVREFGLQPRFRFLPAVYPLSDFLDGLDIFVLPSWNEAFSLVLIEAMASGLPVVATAAGGPAEIVKPDETGLLVPPRDPEALSAALARLLSDDALRQRLGAAARSDVTARFNYERALDQVEAVYRQVLEVSNMDEHG